MEPNTVHGQENERVFPIDEFVLEGNTLIQAGALLKVLESYQGPDKTAGDVEKARGALEKYYHDQGYPAVLVNIPEQSVEGGRIRLEIVESRIRRVKVTDNRYFTREFLLERMPSFHPGEVLYLPEVKAQIARVNRNPDLKVAPILMPGKKPGTIDVEFRVKDKLPLHGSLELNNRSTHTTTDLRLNGTVRYDNLWQKEHSLSLQFQTSPQDMDEVSLLIGSYAMPSVFYKDHMMVLYGLVSDSETATAGNISVVGKGSIVGFRYMIPLPEFEGYMHDLTLGLDFKEFRDRIADDIEIPLEYLPLHAGYSAVMPDSSGQTRFNLGLNMNLRRFSSDEAGFQNKRAAAEGNFIYGTFLVGRRQRLPWSMHLNLQMDGQVTNQALVSNEQFIAGGISSVRGYKESEASGDDAFHGSAELHGPDLGHLLKIDRWLALTPYLFFDGAVLYTEDALAGEEANVTLGGIGAGMRGYLWKYMKYQVDWGVAQEPTDQTDRGHQLGHFSVSFEF